MMRRARKLGGHRRRGRGAAVVEFAVVTPLLLLMLFGIIEYGYIFMVRQTLVNAAREGCRVAVLQTSAEPYTNVTARVNEVMAPTGLTDYTIQMTHATTADPVEAIEISVPMSHVTLLGNFFCFNHNQGTIGGSCSMRKEGMGAPPPDGG